MTRTAPPADAAPADRRGPPESRGTRLASFNGSSYDAAARTVEATLSVGARVRRWFGSEELEISASAVDLARVALGQVRLLDCHNQFEMDAVLGTVENVRVEGSALVGRLRFADTLRAREAEGMVSRGELTGISIGYAVRTWQLVEIDADDREVWRAVSWELLEVSLVSVPADPNAGVRSAAPAPGIPGAPADPQEESEMNRSQPGGAPAPAATPAPAADQRAEVPAAAAAPAAAPAPAPGQRAAEPAPAPAATGSAADPVVRFGATESIDFIDQARAFGVETQARTLVEQNERGEITTASARSALLRAAADHQRAQTSGVPAAGGGARAGDTREASRGAIVEALVARALGRAPAENSGAGEFVGMRLLEIAAVRAGVSPRERDPTTILRAAHTTSDFPIILEAAANRILLDRYQTAAPTYRAIARQRNVRDFKPTKLLRIGDFPTLQAYSEDGEIKAGTINEGRESVTLGSYGRILRLTRQAIVNDDLGAFDDVFGSVGTTVALFENALFFAMKAQNSGLGPALADGVTLFHAATHKNLAGSGAAPDITTLGAGRAAMRKQKNLDGNVLNLTPKFMLVGPDVETVAEQLTASIQPVQNNQVNPFSGKLTVVSDGSIAGNAWELYADPAIAPAFNYGYLADAPGPRVMTEETFNVDGIGMRVTLDFYAAPVDYRPAYRNPGA